MLGRAVLRGVRRVSTTATATAAAVAAPGAARPPPFVSIDGVQVDPAAATISVYDTAAQRGNGAFEVVRVLPGGVLRTPELNLTRLRRTADALGMALPEPAALKSWMTAAAATAGGGGVAAVRVLVTRGGTSLPADPADALRVDPITVCMVEHFQPQAESITLMPLVAPWHPAGFVDPDDDETWETIKWMSYGPNVMSSQKAQRKGFGDALLLNRDRQVLDGPNFAVAWFHDGVFKVPSWEHLGMLQSTTATLALAAANRAGIPTAEGVFTSEELANADEVFALSATRDVLPVSRVGDQVFEVKGPGWAALNEAFPAVYPDFA